MQTEDVLARWRQPAGWRRPGRVSRANASGLDPADPMNAALLAGGVELLGPPLRDANGQVAAEIAASDVVVSGGAPLGEDFFRALRATRLLARPYVGYDDIDVAAATASGVLVTNVPDVIHEDVANHAMAMILAANREILRLDSFVRTGGWATTRRRRPDGILLYRPSSQTLGLVGFGTIGQATARRAAAFGYRLVAHDPYVPEALARDHGVELLPLDDLLRQSDVVSIHMLLNDETRHLIDARWLAQMKPTAWLVNTARGALVDQQALLAALQEGRIGGAALDVMEEEPLRPDSPLVDLDNVILSPHAAGYSEEALPGLARRAAELALQVARGGLPDRRAVVNKDLYDTLAALPELADVPRA